MDASTIAQHKENIQPLRGGRNVKVLGNALQVTPTAVPSDKFVRELNEFELRLREGNAEDPLAPWVDYIVWLEQTQPAHNNKALKKILFKCINKFKREDRFKNDVRFVKVCIRYASQQADTLDLFGRLWDFGIGIRCAYFYMAWAEKFILSGSVKQADKIYEKGINYLAQPIELLKESQKNFHAYLGRQLLNGNTLENESEEPSAVRQAYNNLVTFDGEQRKLVPNVRIGPNVCGTAGRLKQQSLPISKSAAIAIYEDHEEPGFGPKSPSRKHKKIRPYEKVTKENVKKPGVWTISGSSSVPFVMPTSSAGLPFKVHVEEEAEKYSDTNAHTIKNALKPIDEFNVDLSKVNLFVDEPKDPNKKSMYCKEKVYAGNTEFQFEELRAIHYWRTHQKPQKPAIKFLEDDDDKENTPPKGYVGPHGKSTRPTSGILTPSENLPKILLSDDEDIEVFDDDDEAEQVPYATSESLLEKSLDNSKHETDCQATPLDLTVSKLTLDCADEVNPFSESFTKKTLKEMNFFENTPSVAYCNDSLEANSTKYFLLDDQTYDVQSVIRNGEFCKILKVKHKTTDQLKVIKHRMCSNPWELYILREVHNRLGNLNIFMNVNGAMLYKNAFVLIGNYSGECGDLKTILNHYKLSHNRKIMSDYLAKFFTQQMIHIVRTLHSCNIIHGNLQLDDFLVTINSIDEIHLQLTGFERAIDLNLFPPDTKFTCSSEFIKTKCIEMKQNRPWTFQLDYYSLADCIHFILFDDFMDVVETANGFWDIKQVIPRYLNDPWKNLFSALLNTPVDQKPDLKQWEDKLRGQIHASGPHCDLIMLTNYIQRI